MDVSCVGWDERSYDTSIVELRRAANNSAKFCCGKGQFAYGDVTVVNVPWARFLAILSASAVTWNDVSLCHSSPGWVQDFMLKVNCQGQRAFHPPHRRHRTWDPRTPPTVAGTADVPSEDWDSSSETIILS